jgi:chromosomal replication initiator protein
LSALRLISPRLHLRAVVVMESIARHYELRPDQLVSRRKDRVTVEARYAAMYFLRDQFDMNFVQIGRIFNRDHGTVSHACRQIGNWIQTDKSFAERWPQVARKALEARRCAEMNFEGRAE